MTTRSIAARLRLVAAAFFTLGAIFGVEAWLHMRAIGQICGSGHAPHCAACFLAAAAVIAGLCAATGAELRPRLALRPIKRD